MATFTTPWQESLYQEMLARATPQEHETLVAARSTAILIRNSLNDLFGDDEAARTFFKSSFQGCYEDSATVQKAALQRRLRLKSCYFLTLPDGQIALFSRRPPLPGPLT